MLGFSLDFSIYTLSEFSKVFYFVDTVFYGDVKYSCTYSLPQCYVGVSGQLCAAAVLYYWGKNHWCPEQSVHLGDRKICFPFPGLNPRSCICSLVTVPTEPSWFILFIIPSHLLLKNCRLHICISQHFVRH